MAFLATIFSSFLLQDVWIGAFSRRELDRLLDGMIARRRQIITDFGILMDPWPTRSSPARPSSLFIENKQVAAWMCGRHRGAGTCDHRFAPSGGVSIVVLAAERYGKHKTLSQIIAIISVLIVISYP